MSLSLHRNPHSLQRFSQAILTDETAQNVISRYYGGIKHAIASVAGAGDRRSDASHFDPGFELPQLDEEMNELFAPARAQFHVLGEYKGRRLNLLNLMMNPGTRTTKTFASLLMVSRAVRYIRDTGETILILTPTSGNKGIALRDAVERAIQLGLVRREQLRIMTLLPSSSSSKLRASTLSKDPELRQLNPVLAYEGEERQQVKTIGRTFVDTYADELKKRHKINVWYSLDINSYKVADAARAFFDFEMFPATAADAGRSYIHAHAVSSAYGFLGYELGCQVLEQQGVIPAGARPGFFLVQHMDTPDMVLNLHFGSFSRQNLPEYRLDPLDGLYKQDGDPRFPLATFAPRETLDPTFYTQGPPTSPEMNSLIQRYGGGGVVVSLHECMSRYAQMRQYIARAGVEVPADPREVREWSLLMALTGVMNAIDRGLLGAATDVIVHGSGFYTSKEFSPLPEQHLLRLHGVDDLRDALGLA